ncbi:MAG TPA: trypsin-like serine protease [Ideonella sp.]|nr:trypsin-like serine protease [Ideonella sp.]
MKNPARNALALALAAAGLTGLATAQADTKATSISNSGIALQSGWTDADYANAKTLTPKVNHLPASSFDYNAAAAQAQAPKADVAGRRGGADAKHLLEQRLMPVTAGEMDADGGLSPEAIGTGNINFTSTRLLKALDTAYPTRTVGKLYFKKPSGATYMCSGSMIKPGIVVTAGHCIHDGVSSFYNSFQFIPGYRKVGAVETRPYGTWTNWAYARTTSDWVSGGGGVPNLRDWAVIVFNKDAAGKRIGDYTGWLGYQYPSMIGKHQSVVGYPGNLDLGGQMHQTSSMVNNYGSNNGIYGSDMEGGSSGGPSVLNFRIDYTNSSTAPSDNNGNRVTSVVSWGYIDPAQKVQGGSQFDSVFGTIVSDTCTSYAWAC